MSAAAFSQVNRKAIMAADTLGKDAQWWADQTAALKAENDLLNPALDAAKQRIIALETDEAKVVAGLKDQLAAKDTEIGQLKASFDLAAVLNETAQSLMLVGQSVQELSTKLKA